MQRSVVVFLFITALSLVSLAYGQSIDVTCNPSEMFVNTLSTNSFDPVNPANQPILTTVSVSNLSQTAYKFKMNIIIAWNNVEIINFTSKSTNLLHYGIPGIYTNRDLISSSSTQYFDEPEGDVSISHVLSTNDVLRDALQSGYFPDGTLTFRFIATPDPAYLPNAVPDQASFTIRIRNINAIFLSYPGKPIGQVPPIVNIKPVTFIWNAVNTADNDFRLVIKEFVPGNPPNVNSVETGGKKVFDQNVQGNLFTQFLPFMDKHFYAWQVSTVVQDEYQSDSERIKSEWFVFRYSVDSAVSEGTMSELMAILRSLSNNEINTVLDDGFFTTGAIMFEGQVYTGNEALDLARTMIGKDIEVEVTEY